MNQQDAKTSEFTLSLNRYQIKVLLIDDQPFLGEAVRRMLASENDIVFHYCSDPIQAIQQATEIAPTVILQDLVMPEVDGLLLLRFFSCQCCYPRYFDDCAINKRRGKS